MSEWQDINTAPATGWFFAPDRHGDLARVHRFIHPLADPNDVISPKTGRVWRPHVWINIPPPPETAP